MPVPKRPPKSRPLICVAFLRNIFWLLRWASIVRLVKCYWEVLKAIEQTVAYAPGGRVLLGDMGGEGGSQP